MPQDTVKVGIIGCGNISGIYCKNARMLEILDLVACADLLLERAEARAEEFDVPRACSPEELLADDEIEIVINLTTPGAHAEVARQALQAGKSVYNEKPLAVSREDGTELIELARSRGLRLGGAPDTFLGGGIQTCRKLIDDGWIGRPVAATAFMTCHGHESWHPAPEFYYEEGGGPMFDMGPYYLTALLNLVGPVEHVTGETEITFPERRITSEPKYGEMIDVEVPTHVAGIMRFENGAVGTIITSFDVWAANLPRIEIYGTRGSLSVPDPNGFGGPVRLFRPDEGEWRQVPLSHGYSENSRGLGVADMASGIRTGRPHRAGADLTYHVLDLMHAFHDASREQRHAELDSTCERPAALPLGLAQGEID
jgi:predicted dehydrogenase